MSEELSASASNITAETEVQRRRRMRQERILNRGGDRLGRIKDTLGAAQEEEDKIALGVVGGHELKTEAHVAGISLDLLDEASAAKPLRRRAGNLGRKARLEAGDMSSDSGPRIAPTSGEESSVPVITPTDTDVAEEAIADPGADVLSAGPFMSTRRFSAVGLSRAIVKLIPVLGVFVYGINREARYERFVGYNKDDVHAKWTGLLAARPDSRLEEWASGNHLF
ncbi:hypothetical protein GGI21_002759, partial [Coemansia aciculifera]